MEWFATVMAAIVAMVIIGIRDKGDWIQVKIIGVSIVVIILWAIFGTKSSIPLIIMIIFIVWLSNSDTIIKAIKDSAEQKAYQAQKESEYIAEQKARQMHKESDNAKKRLEELQNAKNKLTGN